MFMKKSRNNGVLISVAVGVFFVVFGISNVSGFSDGFQRSLRLGSSGEDVRELQKLLNTDPITRIVEAGPGSPGQETAYFGALTHAAVVRFQEKYRNSVLAPNGLSFGTGFVGPSTIAALSEIKAITEGATEPIAPTTPAAQVSASTNPNLVGLERFLSAIDTASAKQGLSSEKIATIKGQIMKDVATTTDMWAKFTGIAEENSKNVKASDVGLNAPAGALGWVLGALDGAFGAKKAEAQGTTPFGGRLLYPFYCTCSFNWLITLTPLPPTYVVLLSYYSFSQAYLSYNLPRTTSLLGRYTSGGQCLVYAGVTCAGLPTEGLITPIVGSSAR